MSTRANFSAVFKERNAYCTHVPHVTKPETSAGSNKMTHSIVFPVTMAMSSLEKTY